MNGLFCIFPFYSQLWNYFLGYFSINMKCILDSKKGSFQFIHPFSLHRPWTSHNNPNTMQARPTINKFQITSVQTIKSPLYKIQLMYTRRRLCLGLKGFGLKKLINRIKGIRDQQ
jgi:hypothetical protein